MTLEELQKKIAESCAAGSYKEVCNAKTDSPRAAIEGVIADLIIYAAQAANQWPDGPINLEEIVLKRMAAKFIGRDGASVVRKDFNEEYADKQIVEMLLRAMKDEQVLAENARMMARTRQFNSQSFCKEILSLSSAEIAKLLRKKVGDD